MVLGSYAPRYPVGDGLAIAVGAMDSVGPPAGQKPIFGLGFVGEVSHGLNEADAIAVVLARCFSQFTKVLTE